MDGINENNMLGKPFHLLGFSKNFCEKSKLMGFSDLLSVLALNPEDLFNKKGFSYIWLGELTKFLIEQDMLYLLKPKPGNSRV